MLVENCVISALDKKTAVVETKYFEQVQCVGGRRPGGFVEERCRSRAAGEWMARIATVEAASITAFARLVRALEKHGAPAHLIAKARAAMLDEVIHAGLTARLARPMGAKIEAPVIASAGEPTLVELAHENAVEGQVAETFGALLATCQAQLATEPQMRGVFARIAVDEARHAALAHELAGWFDAHARRRSARGDRACAVRGGGEHRRPVRRAPRRRGSGDPRHPGCRRAAARGGADVRGADHDVRHRHSANG